MTSGDGEILKRDEMRRAGLRKTPRRTETYVEADDEGSPSRSPVSGFHTPVLLNEVIDFLKPSKNESFIDGTVGQGGHALEIIKRILPDGRLIAIDRDARNLQTAQERLRAYERNIVFIHDRFSRAPQHAAAHSVNGILLDLGFSSAHVDDPDRGFSFQQTGPLDMRYDTRDALTAQEVVMTWSLQDLERIFRVYGEERQFARAAQMIVRERGKRSFETTTDLADALAQILPRQGKIHPATRVFQALRIAVNDELGEVERALPALVNLLQPGGRIAIITFHSLEDRIIKQYFKAEHGKQLNVLTKKVIKPSRTEIVSNPRSRSAKLRVAERI